MKTVIYLISIALSSLSAFCQPQMKLSTTEHDFGTFKEESGRQTFNFIVTNTGDAPLVIKNVVRSCGCTTPNWTKEPIAPGGSGIVTAIYDPLNRPGMFNKTLTVNSSSKPENVVLVIKGEVIPHEKTIEEIFTYAVGPVRFENQHLPFTNIKKTEKKIRVMPIINTSSSDAKIQFDELPIYLTIKTNPEILEPGQKGLLEATYDATQNLSSWGNLIDYIRVKINGKIQENVLFSVSANLVEDFSMLSKEELLNAPIFKTTSNTVDIGKMAPGTVKEVEFNFTNAGKRNLFIRQIKPSCGCTVIQSGDIQGRAFKPGESTMIIASFNSGANKGKVTKAIYVYSNDPNNPEVVLMLNAEVE
jgi:Protein of unknown function (DUF1573)